MGSISIPTIAAVGAEASADAAAGAGAAASTAAVAGTAATAAAAASTSVFTIGNAAAALGAIGAGVSAYGAHQQGVATANADKQKARVEQLSAGQQQITMRQNMLKAMASQSAQAGAGGVSLGRAGAMRQITESQNDLMVSQANESAQVSLLDQAGSNASTAGNIAAGGDLFQGAAGFGKNFKPAGGS